MLLGFYSCRVCIVLASNQPTGYLILGRSSRSQYWLIPDGQVEWSNRRREAKDQGQNHAFLIDPQQLKWKQVKFACSLFSCCVYICVCVSVYVFWEEANEPEWTPSITIKNITPLHMWIWSCSLKFLFTIPSSALIGRPAELAFWRGSRRRQPWRLTSGAEMCMWTECGSGKDW